jgi:peptide deformylase
MLPQNTQSDEQDILGGGAFDTTGKGVVLNKPVGEYYAQNAASIRTPRMGGPMQMPGSPMGTEDEMDEEPMDDDQMEAESEEALKEHLAALFANSNLSEDFVERAKTIFVAAVNQKLNERSYKLQEAYQRRYSNALASTVSELTEKVDDYLTYVVEEWVNENRLQVERGVKVELAENFIFGLKKLFETNFIDVPDEKYDVLDELYTQIDTQKEHLNKSIHENVSLRKKLIDTAAIAVFAEETAGLAATQVDRLANLAEGVEFDTADEFRRKLRVIKESFLARPAQIQPQVQPRSLPRIQSVNRAIDILETSTVPETLTESTVNAYANAISRHLKNR